MGVEMLSRLAVIHADYYGDKEKALQYANQAAMVNPGQPVLMGAFYAADEDYDPKQYSDRFAGVVEKFDKLEEFEEQANELEENAVVVSPNPFNPSTTLPIQSPSRDM